MPLLASTELDKRIGGELIFKKETANPIRCFKGRGACNLLAQMSADQPLVCASAGNFGQGLAWAAKVQGKRLIVFAARNAVLSKIAAMRKLGAEMVLDGGDFDAAKELARGFAAAEGFVFVEDGAHPAIAEGAGTLAAELTEEEQFDTIVLPLGNGALAAGVGVWMRERRPGIKVIAVAAAGAPAMAEALSSGTCDQRPAETIADGIAIRVPIPYAVEALQGLLDEVVLVTEEELREAMQLISTHLDLKVEPSAAAALAALLSRPGLARGRRVAMPLTGANV